jgi:hypothetical protein
VIVLCRKLHCQNHLNHPVPGFIQVLRGKAKEGGAALMADVYSFGVVVWSQTRNPES